ncbi:NAD(+)/NADH kinase [Acutalibacter sp. 1XD8-33]|uniref:NAD(+)/NADH kinase n=1 Tax=Acutalibacter sp. 1XD8-33 TaxID=2320081 RepID=UPI000EA35635|nr:NAD(+)/NADH kinase [Acutalibacter sp. 1XD8-33]RKJ40914.1 NAD(+)/NADH kinase [Acutalibacter sp. 1XD8-33]
MKIAVAPNLVKRQAQACTDEALAILRSCGCQAVLADGLYGGPPAREAVEAVAACDLLLAIGGDGTIICAAKIAARLDKPVLGINAGKLGFTAGVEPGQLRLLSRLARRDWREERRMTLSVTVNSGDSRKNFLALNDAVVSAELAKIIEYKMAIGTNPGYTYRADGFMIATPTGSTAYSLSAGGPVVEPVLDCMIYTPICPHSLFNRSVVFAPETQLTVEVPRNRGRVFLTVDGEAPLELREGDRLSFFKGERWARFIKLTDNNFYDILNQKLLESQ